jgi:hypothetical protein
LIYLLVGVLDAAQARTAKTQISTAISKAENKVLICAAQFHILLEVFRQDFPRILGRKI